MSRLAVNGTDLFYRLDGEGPETVALFNGIMMTTGSWAPYVEALAPAYRCLRHDFRDQLQSQKVPGRYTLARHADDAAALFDALGLGACHVVGTSYGGEVALELALAYPDRVRSLTLIASVSEVDALMRAQVGLWRRLAIAAPEHLFAATLPFNFSARFLSERPDYVADGEARFDKLPGDYFEGLARLCDAFLGLDLTHRLPEIQAPTLVVGAERDVLKPLRYSRLLANRLPHARLAVVDEAGHAVVVERPDAVARHVTRFLGEVGARR